MTIRLFRAGTFLAALVLGTHAVSAFAAPASASAQGQPQPEATPLPSPLPQPKDIAFPGTLKLSVNATDLDHHVMTMHETVPVPQSAREAGELVLLYPKWVPGGHAPEGTIMQLGGLVASAGGKTIPWLRDPVDVFAFHVPVTKDQTQLDLDFKLLSPVTDDEGRVVMTPHIVNVQWNEVSLYPAGYYSRNIPVQASVTLPHGWQAATALRTNGNATGDTLNYGVVPYNTLVDSPIFAGAYFRKVALNAPGGVPVTLNMVADKPGDLAYDDAELQIHRNLVTQAILTFGSQHYTHYDFLMALTDELGGIGLEHHQSSEDSVSEDYFTDWKHSFPQRDLLAHEYTHSWNGKYRRPADLYGPTFNTPQRGSLLWVYEGQTQFWGNVLAARSGLVSKDQGFEALALIAASYDAQAGRAWRPVADTTNDPIIAQRAPQSWRDYQRSEDYYVEGQLVWLDADMMIRKLSHDTKSLDDFAKAFFGTNNGSIIVSTYTFDDIVLTLNKVVPYDWAKFLHERISTVQKRAPLGGLEAGGYKLVFTDKENAFEAQAGKNRHRLSLRFSLGVIISAKNGKLGTVAWDSPAYKAGLAIHDEIVAVNGDTFSPEGLIDAIKAAKTDKAPITLLVKSGEHYRTVAIPYHDGLRYPHLERLDNTPDRLTTLYSPRH
ncbi:MULTISPECIES: M61 family metallopeptidase [Asaia]|uniref:PDZ domain family protein n=1 Tax=Asaia bogorensis TaxID=91915 RepID=A0A060QCF0_9PROT|nr:MULTISPECIES: M61 family metallopeptidase [Asaia]ETC99398.1 peptidase M61 [Asaia sp. SF2.1]MDL2171541.1 M61 family metallopeptidase [Asaia sp. HumB]CDG38575.1 PDZ domain family protein [Asaia bogorensis]